MSTSGDTVTHFGQLFSLAEGAEKLGISHSTMWRMVRDETIPYVRVGKRVMLAESDLNEFIARNRRGGDDGVGSPVPVPDGGPTKPAAARVAKRGGE